MIDLALVQPFAADALRLSPNHNARPAAHRVIRCVLLHATADRGSESGAESWMQSPASQVSAHLHIRRSGAIVRLVPDEYRAWHAGRSEWRGEPDVNDFSLGWELANRNDGREPYTDAQYEAVALAAAHYARQGLPLFCFASHASVARPIGRKNDPLGFNWYRFTARVNDLLQPSAAPRCAGKVDAGPV